ncbi:MAG: efflux RND transporter permease subunit [Pirellulales bacterium]
MAVRIIIWSLNHRWLVVGIALGFALAGIFSLRSLNLDAFPDTTPVQVQINTPAPALVPEEIERLITFPVELAISGMAGLEQVRSVSQFGASAVIATFRDGTDIYRARQQISERLNTVEVPEGIERPTLGPVATGLGEVFQYTLESKTLDATELRTLHDWVIKPKLRAVSGVAEVNSWGGLEKEYQVRIDPTRLLRHEVSFDEVVDAVRANNLNVGGGNINENETGEMLLVQGVGRTSTIEQIQNIVVTAKQGIPIRVADVADVTIGHQLRKGAVSANANGEVVLGIGFMLMGENSYAVTHRLKDKLEDVKKTLPAGVSVTPVYDRTRLVDQVIATVKANLFDGALLVTAIVFIFLGNLRAGLIVALAIPFSMLFAFSGMLQLGIAGTLLSLGAIDFGIVVDSSLVVIESILRRIAHTGENDPALVRDATIEVRQPTTFGQLIIMIVYLPILSLQGVEGRMFRPMALTVILVLIGSLILSLTLMPVLASFLLPNKIDERDPLLVRIAKRAYAPMLQRALQAKVALLAVTVVALGAAGYLALGLGTEFVPRLSEGDVVVGVLRPAGTHLSEVIAINNRMEKLLLDEFPDEIDHLWCRMGAPEVATDAGDVQVSELFVSLKPREEWSKASSQAELMGLMDGVIGNFPGQTVWLTQPIEQRINEMVSGVRADVALKLFGDDIDTLVAKGRELEKALGTVPGCVDLASEQIKGQPILQVKIDQDSIARYGVSVRTVLDLVESISSKRLGEVIEGQLRFPLAARLPESLRDSPESIAGIMLLAPTRERLPLSMLANVQRIEGPKMISREWSRRRITVQCNVRGRDIGSFIAEAQKRISADVKLPEGFTVEWGGQFENMQRAQRRLAIVVPLALGLILVLLYVTYKNVMDTLCVFTSVPLACIGGILFLWLRGMPISISAAVGFITLSGVSVLNSMVFVSAFRDLLHLGSEPGEAVVTAAMTRLRTVMMTALVASVGFAPMAFSSGMGAEVQRPLATVVIGGVISSTVMTLFVMPALYRLLVRRDPQPEVVPG